TSRTRNKKNKVESSSSTPSTSRTRNKKNKHQQHGENLPLWQVPELNDEGLEIFSGFSEDHLPGYLQVDTSEDARVSEKDLLKFLWEQSLEEVDVGQNQKSGRLGEQVSSTAGCSSSRSAPPGGRQGDDIRTRGRLCFDFVDSRGLDTNRKWSPGRS
ncbi:unnamed protein product, partial [Amoebophrya sp. A25]